MIFSSTPSGYKLRLASKKLASGKYQVKFVIKSESKGKGYGYLLVDPNTTLKEVIGKIRDSISQTERKNSYKKQRHLFSLRKTHQGQENFIFFN